MDVNLIWNAGIVYVSLLYQQMEHNFLQNLTNFKVFFSWLNHSNQIIYYDNQFNVKNFVNPAVGVVALHDRKPMLR